MSKQDELCALYIDWNRIKTDPAILLESLGIECELAIVDAFDDEIHFFLCRNVNKDNLPPWLTIKPEPQDESDNVVSLDTRRA